MMMRCDSILIQSLFHGTNSTVLTVAYAQWGLNLHQPKKESTLNQTNSYRKQGFLRRTTTKSNLQAKYVHVF